MTVFSALFIVKKLAINRQKKGRFARIPADYKALVCTAGEALPDIFYKRLFFYYGRQPNSSGDPGQ